MKIGITGADGFIGGHLRAYLHSVGLDGELRLATRATYSDSQLLKAFVDQLDVVVHLAGINRADETELFEGNISLASQLADALQNSGTSASILYASSIHEQAVDAAYGRGKLEAGKILEAYCNQQGSVYFKYLIPHVFGEHGRPFYNSAVSTFCYQIANGEPVEVNGTGQVELVHVQDLVERMMEDLQAGNSGLRRVEGHSMSVPALVEKLQTLQACYVEEGQIPDLNDSLTRALFNTLRSYIDLDSRVVKLAEFNDERGDLTELIKANSGGQCFISSTRPGYVRGNHYHRRKFERFAVLRGKARISLRRLFTEQVDEILVDGDQPSFIDIPTLHTHMIENIGDTELLTLFWSDEIFDPENPDTTMEPVQLQ